MTAPTKRNQVIEVVVGLRVADAATKSAPIAIDMMSIKVDCLRVVAKLACKAVTGSSPGSWTRSPFLPHRLSAPFATRLTNVFPASGGGATVAAESGTNASLIDRHPIPDISLAALLAVYLAAVCEWATALGANTQALTLLMKFSRATNRLVNTALAALSARLGFCFMTAIAYCHDYLPSIQYHIAGDVSSRRCHIAGTGN